MSIGSSKHVLSDEFVPCGNSSIVSSLASVGRNWLRLEDHMISLQYDNPQ